MMAFLEMFLQNGVAQAMLLLSVTIVLGILAAKIKVRSISLGVTWILFVGIFIGHFECFNINAQILSFIKEFGLILFVYAVGSQCGANFFSSLKNGGLSLNLLAVALVVLNVVVTLGLAPLTNESLASMTGLMSGAVTNTPGLGAAQQTYTDITGEDASFIGAGYAIAYPMGVIGVILIFVLMKNFCKGNRSVSEKTDSGDSPVAVSIKVVNPQCFSKTLVGIRHIIEEDFVITRLYHPEKKVIEMPTKESVIHESDVIYVVATEKVLQKVEQYIGPRIDMDMTLWSELDSRVVSKRLRVTEPELEGKTIGSLDVNAVFGSNISRIIRADLTMIPNDDFKLHIGDTLVVVGPENAVKEFGMYIGNTPKKLRNPYLLPIFLGIFAGVFLGLIPFNVPGVPQPVKLGLAGGPLLVAILLNRFGYRLRIVTYATSSAMRMLQELGIAMFLAAVGLSSGKMFFATLVEHGVSWFLYGTVITMLPIIIVSVFAYLVMKLNVSQIMGLISGATTNPAALAFANTTDDTGRVSMSYATVYPLAMLIRITAAQFLILQCL